MANKNHFINVNYSIDHAAGDFTIKVTPNGEAPGLTDIVCVDVGKEVARIMVNDEQLPLLIEALQRRLEDVARELQES